MGMWIGRNRKARVTYGFDEIALVPGEITINPNEVNTSFEIPRPNGQEPLKLKIPIIASAMDGVTNVRFCVEMARLGGLGVVNLVAGFADLLVALTARERSGVSIGDGTRS